MIWRARISLCSWNQSLRQQWLGTLLTGHLGNPDLLAAAAIATIADGPYLDQVVLFEGHQQLSRCVVCLQNVGFALSVLPVQDLNKTVTHVKGTCSFSEVQTL